MEDRLTRREVQCIRLAGEGLTNKQIGRQLKIAPQTVNNHISNAYAKLGTSDRFRAAEAVAVDYPNISQIIPATMGRPATASSPRPAPDAAVAVSGDARNMSWPLPRPDGRTWVRLLIVLCFVVLTVTVVAGVVSFLAASVSTAADKAPPGAIRSLG